MNYFKKVMENNNSQKRSGYEFAAFLNEGAFIGFADILVEYHLSKVKHGEIGYFLLPMYWGQEFATEIAKTLTDICFKELNMHKVVASCNANNRSSENIMKKIGMTKEGTFRKGGIKTATGI